MLCSFEVNSIIFTVNFAVENGQKPVRKHFDKDNIHIGPTLSTLNNISIAGLLSCRVQSNIELSSGCVDYHNGLFLFLTQTVDMYEFLQLVRYFVSQSC